MEEKSSGTDQSLRNNERQGGVPYRQLAADMAPCLANQQFSRGDNEVADNNEENNENETESTDGARETPLENNNRRRRNHYEELAAEMAQPLADLQVAGGDNNALNGAEGGSEPVKSDVNDNDVLDGVKSGNKSLRNDVKNRSGKTKGKRKEKNPPKGSRNYYFDVAANVSDSFKQLRTPGSNDDRDSLPQSEATGSLPYQESLSEHDQAGSGSVGYRRESSGSVAQQESISEYNPDATCGSASESCVHLNLEPEMHSEDWSGTEYDRKKEETETMVQQESFSEYNPDATCGSCGESCGGFRDGDSLSDRGEDIKPVAQQESLSEYDENASCGSGFFRSENESFEYSSIQTEDSRSCNEGSYRTEDSHSKSTADFDATYGECYSKTDGEPYSKRTKPNPDTKFDPCLSADFENMNLADNVSVESGRNDFSFTESPASSFQSNSTQDSWKEPQMSPKINDRGVNSNSNNFSELGDYGSHYSAPVGNSQGARPKTTGKVPHGKKSKQPKQNTKNAYTELAKDLVDDLSAMNRQLEGSRAEARGAKYKGGSGKGKELLSGSTRERPCADSLTDTCREASGRNSDRENQELSDESTVDTASPAGRSMLSDRQQVLCDGSLQTEMSTGTSLHSYPSEGEGLSLRQQTSMATDEELEGVDISNPREKISTSKDARRNGPSAEERRAHIEEQQRLIDNMAPELQSLVIQMMQNNEEEERGYATHNLYYNRPVPARTLPPVPAPARNTNQGACAFGASKQRAGGKKSRKGPKSKGHYVELAGIIAPQLAEMNAAMVNGHGKEPRAAETTASGMHTGNEPPKPQPGAHHETYGMDANLTGARPRDHMSFSGTRLQSRNQSRGHLSMPYPVAQGRDTTDGRGASTLVGNGTTSSRRRGNANMTQGGSKAPTGKENRGRQKKTKAEETSKSMLFQMAENTTQSFQQLNELLEAQQRPPLCINGNGGAAAAHVSPEHENGRDFTAEEAVIRDESSAVTSKSTPSRTERSDR